MRRSGSRLHSYPTRRIEVAEPLAFRSMAKRLSSIAVFCWDKAPLNWLSPMPAPPVESARRAKGVPLWVWMATIGGMIAMGLVAAAIRGFRPEEEVPLSIQLGLLSVWRSQSAWDS